MREALFIAVVATLLIAAAVESSPLGSKQLPLEVIFTRHLPGASE
jgi:hypothetical protein